jgi:hypothetical protein
MIRQDRGSINWLTCVGIFLGLVLLGSVLLCLVAFRPMRPTYVAVAKLMPRSTGLTASSADMAKLDGFCARTQQRVRRAASDPGLEKLSPDARRCVAGVKIERVPGSAIIRVEASATVLEVASAIVDVAVERAQKSYAETAKPSLGAKPQLKLVEDTHVFPVNRSVFARYALPVGIIGVNGSIILIIIVVVAGLLNRRKASQPQ